MWQALISEKNPFTVMDEVSAERRIENDSLRKK